MTVIRHIWRVLSARPLFALYTTLLEFCHSQSVLFALSLPKSLKLRLARSITLKAHIGDALGKLASRARKVSEKLVTPTGIEPVFQP